jgi:hypothetical protein
MSNKNLLDLSDIFFEALEYPQFARPNFFLNKQSTTNWAKGVYLTALNEVYHHCKSVLKMHFNKQKQKSEDLKLEDFEISIKDLVQIENNKLVNLETLDSLFYSLQFIPYFDRSQKNYTPLEVISCVETALIFIKNEYYKQIKKAANPLFRAGTKNYFNYLIAEDSPFFDFPKFKNAFRELLYSSKSSVKIEKLFISFHKAAVEIVKLWNEEIYFIEQKTNVDGNKFQPERVRVEFNADSLKQTWWTDEKMFDNCIPHEFFLNQDFASLAAKIANLINGEIIHGSAIKIKEAKKIFINDFIEGIQHLQVQNESEASVKNIIDKKLLEAPFRNFFSTWFKARMYEPNSESLRGTKHIDLKVEHPSIEKKIIEFKGWWNPKKHQLIFQLFNYLTQFDGEGYIFIINHSNKEIHDDYKKIIGKEETGYLKNSWKTLRYKRSSFYYHVSQHKLETQSVKVFHLIFNVHKPRNVH